MFKKISFAVLSALSGDFVRVSVDQFRWAPKSGCTNVGINVDLLQANKAHGSVKSVPELIIRFHHPGHPVGLPEISVSAAK